MKNRTIGLVGIAFAALCLAVPAPTASAAEGDPIIVMVEEPSYACVPGPTNDEIGLPKIVTGIGVVDAVVQPTWQPAANGTSIRVGEVYPIVEDQAWEFAPDSWAGEVFTDDGGDCGQEPEPIVIPIPPAPNTSPDDPSKEGDVQWVGFENSAQYIYGYNADGELFVSAGDGYIFEGNVMDFKYGFPPDVYNPPTSGDPGTPPDNGGGTGGDNGGSTPPASTPDTSAPSTGGQVPTSGSNDKSGADTSKDGKKPTSTTSQIRRPGHNGAVSRDVVAYTGAGYENNVPADGFVLFALAGVGLWLSRRRASSI